MHEKKNCILQYTISWPKVKLNKSYQRKSLIIHFLAKISASLESSWSDVNRKVTTIFMLNKEFEKYISTWWIALLQVIPSFNEHYNMLVNQSLSGRMNKHN